MYILDIIPALVIWLQLWMKILSFAVLQFCNFPDHNSQGHNSKQIKAMFGKGENIFIKLCNFAIQNCKTSIQPNRWEIGGYRGKGAKPWRQNPVIFVTHKTTKP